MKLLKNKIFWGFVASIIALVLGFIFSHAYDFGLCIRYNPSCNQGFLNLGTALFYPSLALAVVFLVLIIFPSTVRPWWKFARWYIPISALILIMWRPVAPGSWDFTGGMRAEAMDTASTYIGISLGIVATSLIADWRRKRNAAPLRWWWYWLGAIIGMFLVARVYRPAMELLVPALNSLF